ncbi:MAG: hypothetical protein RR825_01755 [Ruthenibacterium sp.]
MKKLLMAANILCMLLTFAGAGYILYTGGRANAGYAVIPMVLTLVASWAYRKQRAKK